ncbi:hypothetical protein EYF80_022549 [Liparis tanakae]|uniref:Uncharacterized protein n=1 Tax=Liparis tanakae TaxID=230148 RepID=A0A4Z2HNS3_9TELE|nr:hypothetical protein EYF80_022549 [Liparis tanakae]
MGRGLDWSWIFSPSQDWKSLELCRDVVDILQLLLHSFGLGAVALMVGIREALGESIHLRLQKGSSRGIGCLHEQQVPEVSTSSRVFLAAESADPQAFATSSTFCPDMVMKRRSPLWEITSSEKLLCRWSLSLRILRELAVAPSCSISPSAWSNQPTNSSQSPWNFFISSWTHCTCFICCSACVREAS